MAEKKKLTQRALETLDSLIVPLDLTKIKFKWLLYGGSGVGKTVEAMEVAQRITPDDKRILFIDTGEGWVSLENHPQLKRRTDRMLYTGLAQFETLVSAIQEGVERYTDYGTVVFDEFSTSAKKFLHVVLDATNVNYLTGAPEFKHWGILSRNVEQTIWQLLELKETHNLIFIAHERTKEDQRTKIWHTEPSFMESLGATVRENVHVVSRMTASVENRTGVPKYKRELQVHPTKMITAKSRVGGLEILVPPSKFNDRVVDWMNSGELVDEQEVVELESEKEVSGDFSDQTDFVGIEVGEL